MKLLLDYNYTLHCKGNLLGYVGETDSRKITVEGYQTDGADLYKLRLSMPDKSEYEVDISSGEYTIPGSLLSTAGYVRLQVLAVRSTSNGYEYIKKSNVLSGIRVEESLDGTTEPVPTYEDAVQALDKVLAAVDVSADNAAKSEQFAESANAAITAAESARTAAQQAADNAATSYEGAERAAQQAVQSAQEASVSAYKTKQSEKSVLSAKSSIDSTAATIYETAQEVSQNVQTVLQSTAATEIAKDIAVAKAEEIFDSAEQINQNTADILMLYNKADGIVCEAEGKEIRLSDSSNLGFKGMRFFGRSMQEGTPNPDAPVPIMSVGDSGAVTVTISNNDDTQSLILQTSDGLLGIPLNSGSAGENYTDKDGVRWQCDEIDLERGVCVKRVGDILLDGVNLTLSRSGNPLEHTLRYACKLPSELAARTSNVRCLSPSLPWVYSYWADEEHQYVQGEMAFVFIDSDRLDGFADINDYLKAYPIRIVCALLNPLEIPLSAGQIAEYKSLHTYKPTTVITNSDNAHMAVDYTADTKAYIDNKFADVISAIISTGGNV